MPFSISNSTTFSQINWDNLKNRPSITESMPQCKESNWNEDAPCCMSGYAIEHVRDTVKNSSSPEVNFLNEYPCLNGPELDIFLDKFDEPSNHSSGSILSTIATRIRSLFTD